MPRCRKKELLFSLHKEIDRFQFVKKRIVSNPKGINRKKLVPFVLSIKLAEKEYKK